MSQSEPGPKPELTCWECGATNRPDARKCWLCRRRNWRSGAIAVGEGPGAPPGEPPLSPGSRGGKAATTWIADVSVVIASVAAFLFGTVILFVILSIAVMIALSTICTLFLGAHH
jgi:hypothetical protein